MSSKQNVNEPLPASGLFCVAGPPSHEDMLNWIAAHMRVAAWPYQNSVTFEISLRFQIGWTTKPTFIEAIRRAMREDAAAQNVAGEATASKKP